MASILRRGYGELLPLFYCFSDSCSVVIDIIFLHWEQTKKLWGGSLRVHPDKKTALYWRNGTILEVMDKAATLMGTQVHHSHHGTGSSITLPYYWWRYNIRTLGFVKAIWYVPLQSPTHNKTRSWYQIVDNVQWSWLGPSDTS